MTTDIRAALREIADMLCDPVLRCDPGIARILADRATALADAPPTVADLLPRVDARHEVHWNDDDGMRWRVVARPFGGSTDLVVETQDSDSLRWMAHKLYLRDIIMYPATLVEVTP